jgi:hypothetical protein
MKGYLENQGVFHKPGELLGAVPNGNAPRSAVTQSATDKITELLLRTLANPATPLSGSKLYLVIFQVTCNPGWRTLQGYMADVNVHWEYARHCIDGTVALSLSDNAPSSPSVIAMLPLVDAQNMDLRNSQRELFSLLASLSASGALGGGNAAGKGVLDYVRSYQKDAASRNAMPVVNSYSTSVGMGFRFSPSFVAIADPARKRSRAANMLIPTSFPVLAVLSIDKEDIRRHVSRCPEVAANGYDQLVLAENFRWLVRDRRISLLPWDWHLPARREDEPRRFNVAEESTIARTKFAHARDAFAEDSSGASFYDNPDYQLLRTDYIELSSKIGGNWNYTSLDPYVNEPKLTIEQCRPSVIDPMVDTALTIQGEHFSPDVRVFLGGQECSVASVNNEKTIVALFKASSLLTVDHLSESLSADDPDLPEEPGATSSRGFSPMATPTPSPAAPTASKPGGDNMAYAQLVVASKTNIDSRWIKVDLTKQKEKKENDAAPKTVQVTRDAQGNVMSVDFSRLKGLSTKEILDATVQILGVKPASK